MKKVVMTMVVLLLIGGCLPLASDIQNVGQQTLLVSEQIDALQDVISTLDEETAGRFDKINKEIDRIQPTLVEVATAVKDADYVDGETFGNAISGLQAANAASAPVNPYAVPIGAGLTALGLLAEMLRRKEKQGRLKEAAKRQADKVGRERTLREAAALGEDLKVADLNYMMYRNIGDARAHNGVT